VSRALRTVILIGALYLAIGLTFSALAGSASSHKIQVVWRLLAYLVSAGVFSAHVAYEYFRLRSAPRIAAWHAAAAVALGAFGLAVAANLHARFGPAATRHAIGVAIIAWPLLCGLPAFVVAFAATAVLSRIRPQRIEPLH